MNVPEAAEALGLSRAAVHKAIERGTLPARLMPTGPTGPWYLIQPGDVDAYRAEHLRPTGGGLAAYGEVAVALGAGASIDDLTTETIESARAYARRRHQRWPPRTSVSGVVVTIPEEG